MLDFVSLVPSYFFLTHCFNLPTTLYWESLFLPRLINDCRGRGNIERNNLSTLFIVEVERTSACPSDVLRLCRYHTIFGLRQDCIVGLRSTRANTWFLWHFSKHEKDQQKLEILVHSLEYWGCWVRRLLGDASPLKELFCPTEMRKQGNNWGGGGNQDLHLFYFDDLSKSPQQQKPEFLKNPRQLKMSWRRSKKQHGGY